MKQKSVEKWISKNAEKLKKEILPDEWILHIEYAYLEGSNKRQVPMQVKVLPEYRKGTIWICPEHIDSESELEECFKHELFHLILNPYELILETIEALVPASSRKAVGSLFNQAAEQTVRNLELSKALFP